MAGKLQPKRIGLTGAEESPGAYRAPKVQIWHGESQVKLSGKRTLTLEISGKSPVTLIRIKSNVTVDTDGASARLPGANLSGYRQRCTHSKRAPFDSAIPVIQIL